jgi:hypothetical protein
MTEIKKFYDFYVDGFGGDIDESMPVKISSEDTERIKFTEHFKKILEEKQLLTFCEWVAWDEADDKDNYQKYIPETITFLRVLLDCDVHYGDCTRSAQSCSLCRLQRLLDEYEKYCISKDWMPKLKEYYSSRREDINIG